MASKILKAFLAFLLGLALISTAVWFGYLGPRVRVRTFVTNVNPMLSDLIWFDAEINKMINENPFANLDITKPADLQEFKAEVKKISALLAKAQTSQEKFKKELEGVPAGEETEDLKASIAKLTEFGIETIPQFQEMFTYIEEQIAILELKVLDQVDDTEPTSLAEARQQITGVKGAFGKLIDELNKLNPPPALVKFHTEIKDTFTKGSSALDDMLAALDPADEAKFQAALDRFKATEDDIDNISIEKSMETHMNRWLADENKLLKQVERESKALLEEFGPSWAIRVAAD